jgi:hypothetical protein
MLWPLSMQKARGEEKRVGVSACRRVGVSPSLACSLFNRAILVLDF